MLLPNNLGDCPGKGVHNMVIYVPDISLPTTGNKLQKFNLVEYFFDAKQVLEKRQIYFYTFVYKNLKKIMDGLSFLHRGSEKCIAFIKKESYKIFFFGQKLYSWLINHPVRMKSE